MQLLMGSVTVRHIQVALPRQPRVTGLEQRLSEEDKVLLHLG